MNQPSCNKKSISLKRADELNECANTINENLEASRSYDESEYRQAAADRKATILKYYDATDAEWDDYIWQMQNRIRDIGVLNELFGLTPNRYEEIADATYDCSWAITPYYLSLIDVNAPEDELGMMAIPSHFELLTDRENSLDPMKEEYTNPAGSITRRYPDRLLISATSNCATLCRFCQRRRNFTKKDNHKHAQNVQASIDYIRATSCVRDVLITGGDPFTLADDYLEEIISAVRDISHVEIIRIGTRIPATLPQRITNELSTMLSKYHPLYVNVHFNHPKELTVEAREACTLLADKGIPLGNQMVLLKGVNNNKNTVLQLNRELLKMRVRPYYIFHPKLVTGTTHFYCALEEGLEIIDYLTGNTSGLAKPHYIINAPDGKGKVPLLNQKFKRVEEGKYELTTWENEVVPYP